MLAALNHLRSVRVDELAAGRGGPATRWARVYWLEVDYLAVAAAALRCAACFTALLYLEHWCEAAHGRLTLGDDQPLAAVRPHMTSTSSMQCVEWVGGLLYHAGLPGALV